MVVGMDELGVGVLLGLPEEVLGRGKLLGDMGQFGFKEVGFL